MDGPRSGPAGDLQRVVGWLALLWMCFIVQVVLLATTGLDLRAWGVVPQTGTGLVGIFAAPLLHANLAHIASNSFALLILGWIACGYSRGFTAIAVSYAVLVGGAFTWLVAPAASVHIGASGVVFGLIGFLVLNGLVRRGCIPLLITAVVALLFGGALLTVLRTTGPDGQLLSWQMHLGGLVGGASAAWQLRRRHPPR